MEAVSCTEPTVCGPLESPRRSTGSWGRGRDARGVFDLLVCVEWRKRQVTKSRMGTRNLYLVFTLSRDCVGGSRSYRRGRR